MEGRKMTKEHTEVVLKEDVVKAYQPGQELEIIRVNLADGRYHYRHPNDDFPEMIGESSLGDHLHLLFIEKARELLKLSQEEPFASLMETLLQHCERAIDELEFTIEKDIGRVAIRKIAGNRECHSYREGRIVEAYIHNRLETTEPHGIGAGAEKGTRSRGGCESIRLFRCCQ